MTLLSLQPCYMHPMSGLIFVWPIVVKEASHDHDWWEHGCIFPRLRCLLVGLRCRQRLVVGNIGMATCCYRVRRFFGDWLIDWLIGWSLLGLYKIARQLIRNVQILLIKENDIGGFVLRFYLHLLRPCNDCTHTYLWWCQFMGSQWFFVRII